MRRTAVFAHFDKDNIIDDYVIFYLKELKKIAQNVIFVSCEKIPENELKKLEGVADFSLCEHHKEYDFGSYKRGFELALQKNLLDDTDELIFANDSCFGPLRPLPEVFDEMEKHNCDFWGITKSKSGLKYRFHKFLPCKRPHLQSYFLVFTKPVFMSDIFKNFIKNIEYQENKNFIIEKYEIGLSELLGNNGFKDSFYMKNFYTNKNATIYLWRELVETGSPFVKKALFELKNRKETTICNWEEVITTYPKELIKSKEINKKYSYFAKKEFFKFLYFQPTFLRQLLVKIFLIIIPDIFD